MNDDAYTNTADAQGEDDENETILNTGSVEEELLEEIAFSDLLDLSDPEEMDALADELDPMNLPQLVDEDGAEMAKYTKDADILDEFTNRQQINAGTEQLMADLKDHTGQGPETSAQDVDAAWDIDLQSGEESVGASVATPEQNVVSELGEALGLEYKDHEPLNTEDKIAARDENRWELSIESMMAEEDEEDGADLDEDDEDMEDIEDSDLLDTLLFDDEGDDAS
jgi:hypothetical protein